MRVFCKKLLHHAAIGQFFQQKSRDTQPLRGIARIHECREITRDLVHHVGRDIVGQPKIPIIRAAPDQTR